MATFEPRRAPESPEGGGPDSLPRTRAPFLIGRSSQGASTMWFLERVPSPLPGPWDVAVLLRKA